MTTWIGDNLQILATLGSAFALYIFMRIGVRKDIHDLEKRFDHLERRINKIDEKLDAINMRLTRLEGRFEERGYWESRDYHKTGTDDKKQSK